MAAMTNPSGWPDYRPDDENAWSEFCMMPGRIPRSTAPEDVPLPFDRTNGSRNYTQLFGKSGTFLIKEGIRFVRTCRPGIRLDLELEAKLGVVSDFNYVFKQVQEHLTGLRPYPAYAVVLVNSAKNPAWGDGYLGAIYAGIHEKRWSPMAEIIFWSDHKTLFHRMVPVRDIATPEGFSGDQRLLEMLARQSQNVVYPEFDLFRP